MPRWCCPAGASPVPHDEYTPLYFSLEHRRVLVSANVSACRFGVCSMRRLLLVWRFFQQFSLSFGFLILHLLCIFLALNFSVFQQLEKLCILRQFVFFWFCTFQLYSLYLMHCTLFCCLASSCTRSGWRAMERHPAVWVPAENLAVF